MAFFKKTAKEKKKKIKVNVPNNTALNTSVLISNIVIDGNFKTEANIDLSGTINGDVTCYSIVIRENGLINGNITANSIVKISGKVQGTIRAKSVLLNEGGRVEGNVYQESLVIEDGAFLDGQCKRLAEKENV